MPLTIAGIAFPTVPDLVFTDDQPLPMVRGVLQVNAKLAAAEVSNLRKAIDEDERAVIDTAYGHGEIEIRSFTYAPEEGVVRSFEGLDVRSWTFKK
ncbi:MAG TPA: hypothetical protein VI997_06770 [Candidatus Thermoplasmatota archaeon]|nr:hypothetical protein [Candidatus Thermoplasmatota archaeon]